MEEFNSLYKKYRTMYYVSDIKDSVKSDLARVLLQLPLNQRKLFIGFFQKGSENIWKEFDYFMYSQLISLSGCEDCADISFITRHILEAFGTKEIFILSMEVFKLLHSRIDLQAFLERFFIIYNQSHLDMSYYSYLLPTIKSTFGDDGLNMIQSMNCSTLSKLHAMRFNQRTTFSSMVGQHLDDDSVNLLFELICKRREKLLAYEQDEIDFIYDTIGVVDAPALNYFKYFISHLCITFNRSKHLFGADKILFKRLQEKSVLLMSEGDILKARRGVRLHVDLYNCLIKSDFKTSYALPTKEKFLERKSPVYTQLLESNHLKIGTKESEQLILSLVNENNFHIFEEIFNCYEISSNTLLTKGQVFKFFNNLEDDYLEDKIDVVIKLLIKLLDKDEGEIFIKDFIATKTPFDVSYKLYRDIKMTKYLILGSIERHSLENVLKRIIDDTMHIGNSKLSERILVSAVDLLTSITSASETSIESTLAYLIKVICCNRRYAASSAGLIYRRFISKRFKSHEILLLAHVNVILDGNQCSTSSKMRRALEKRTLIQEFCLGVPYNQQKQVTGSIFNNLIQQLNKNDDHNALKSNIFCINALLADATLKRHTSHFVLPLITYCLKVIDESNNFAVSNAIYTLYATLVQRLLPYHDHTRNMAMDDLIHLCPHIYDNFDLVTSKRSNILIMLLLQRTNCEGPRSLQEDNRILRQVQTFLENTKIFTFETEVAINLWVNLIGQTQVNRTIHEFIASQCCKSFNQVRIKYQLFDGLCRKYNRKEFFRGKKEKFNKMRVRVIDPVRRHFCIKPLTIEETIKRIQSSESNIYEKITGFEVLAESFEGNEQLTGKLMKVYVSFFINMPPTYFYEYLITFQASFHRLIRHFVNFEQTFYISIPDYSVLRDLDTLSKRISYCPCLLAFLLCLSRCLSLSVEGLNKIKNAINFVNILSEFDFETLRSEDVTSLVFSFKFITENSAASDKPQIYLLALQLLHSELLSIEDYLVPYILNGVNIDIELNQGHGITAQSAIRFMLSSEFLDNYFLCNRVKCICVIRYLRWRSAIDY